MHQLKSSGDAEFNSFGRRKVGDVLPVVKNPAFFRRIKSAEKIDKGCFPGPVGADDAQRLLIFQFKVDVINRNKVSEFFGDPLGGHHWLVIHH